MPLVINGLVVDELPSDTRQLFETYPHFKDVSASLVAQVPKVVGPVGLVYVLQREYAIVTPHDKSTTILGTDDTTTCCLAVLRHTGSGVVCLAHYDGSGLESAIETMIRKMDEINLSLVAADGHFELHLVGGFIDGRGFSEELVMQLLYTYHKQLVNIHLVTACVCQANSTQRGGANWPIIYGIGVNVKTGQLFPATFPDKGPDIPLRCARHFTGCREMIEIYDTALGLLRIGPFNYNPMRGVDLWLAQNDEFILKHLSTSPEVEPPQFVACARTTLKFIQQNPFPGVTIFPDNRPRYYRKDEGAGQWLPVCY